jgi:hypothetical protein
MATRTIDWERSGRVSSGPRNAGTRAEEVPLYLDPEQVRPVEYLVYIHTISKRSFMQPHSLYGELLIRACPKDKRYLTAHAIRHPLPYNVVDPENVSGPPIVKFENAKRVALGICNPDYVGTDLDIQDRPADLTYRISSSECNLTRQGVFASLNAVPTEEELKKAENRRIEYYKFRFEEANALQRSDPKRLQDILIEDHHLAAEMFGIDVDWHRVVTPKIECPNCGEKIKEGIAFHRVNGDLCVLDWEKAYLAGAVKKDQVPDEKKWWAEEKRGPGRPKVIREEAE